MQAQSLTIGLELKASEIGCWSALSTITAERWKFGVSNLLDFPHSVEDMPCCVKPFPKVR